MRRAVAELSREHESLIRHAVAALGGGTVDGHALCQGMIALYPRQLPWHDAEGLLARANRAGLLLRGGVFLSERFRIDDDWKRGPMRPDAGHRRLQAQRASRPPRAVSIQRALVPSLGTPCGDPEVIPAHIGDGIDAMHRSQVRCE